MYSFHLLVENFNPLPYDLVVNRDRYDYFTVNGLLRKKDIFMLILCLRLFERLTIDNRKVTLDLYFKKVHNI